MREVQYMTWRGLSHKYPEFTAWVEDKYGRPDPRKPIDLDVWDRWAQEWRTRGVA